MFSDSAWHSQSSAEGETVMVAVDTGLGDAQIDYERLIAESVVQVAERRSSGSGVTLPELAVR